MAGASCSGGKGVWLCQRIVTKKETFEDDVRKLVNTFGDGIKLTVNHFINVWRISPFKGFPSCSTVSHVSGIC